MTGVGIFVHDIGSKQIRVKFNAPMASADDVGAYELTSVVGGASPVPTIIAAEYYDSDRLSVALTLSASLTLGATYSCLVTGLFSDGGQPVTDQPFVFYATDVNAPIILGAYQSLRGCVDLIFDRDVAQTSSSATATLTGPTESLLMTLVPWAVGRPENAIRMTFVSELSGPSGPWSVDFDDVYDASGNLSSGTIGLSLAYDASTFSDLKQATITHAHVVDVSNAAEFSVATMRVFFNCPMLESDVLNESKWHCYQDGAHAAADLDNEVTSSDASDLSSLLILANEIKTRLNAHFLSHAHTVTDIKNIVTEPTATDLDTVCTLLLDEEDTLISHLEQIPEHKYQDYLNQINKVSLPDLASAISIANLIKAKFNNHIQSNYILSLSNSYTPLDKISNFASSSNAAAVSDPYTWYADLHFSTNVTHADFFLSVDTINSEDAGSSLSVSYPPGIQILSAASDPSLLSVSPLVRGAAVRMQSGVEICYADSALLTQTNSRLLAQIRTMSSLPNALWALNNAIQAYSMHISDPSLSPYTGAGHPILDTVNTVSISDFAQVMDLSDIIDKANAFKEKLSSHMISTPFHYGNDEAIDAPVASDLDSLSNLIEVMQNRLTNHNSSGLYPNGSTSPDLPIYHDFPGKGVVSVGVKDMIMIEASGFKNNVSVSLTMPVSKIWWDNYTNTSVRVVPGRITTNFTGIDTPPVLVSAVSRPGINPENLDPYILSDSVELYMSKPMQSLVIMLESDPSMPYVSITGSPNPFLLEASWLNSRVASVRVSRMNTASYSVGAFGFQDLAGNLLV